MSPLTLTSLMSCAPAAPPNAGARADSIEDAQRLKTAYTQFVGETFFGTMLKSMRATVGEPAYFHGGMAEEQFQARLDQQMAADLAGRQGGDFADAFFEHQFPREAALLADATRLPEPNLDDLATLRTR